MITCVPYLHDDTSPSSPPDDDKGMESWVPCDIFETQLFEEDCYDHVRKMEIAKDLVPVMNTLSYLT